MFTNPDKPGIFASIPFDTNGGFPERIKSWCTVCRQPAFITNIRTEESTKLLTEEWVDGNLVLILKNGERWKEDQLRKCWKPFKCH